MKECTMPLSLFHKKYSQNLSEILQLSEINIKTGKFVQFCVADSMQPLFVFFSQEKLSPKYSRNLSSKIFSSKLTNEFNANSWAKVAIFVAGSMHCNASGALFVCVREKNSPKYSQNLSSKIFSLHQTTKIGDN